MVDKGRWNPKSARVGEENGTSKLTDDLVRQIRKTNFAFGELSAFCREIGVTPTLVWMVKKNKIWRHVK